MEQSVMESIYEKIRTPYKIGAVLKFEDFYCDSPVVFRYKNRFLMSFVKIDKQKLTGYTTHLAESTDLIHWTKWEGKPLIFCEYEWENVHAHKPWVICVDGTVYHYYCAVNDRNERYIALATSSPLH